MEATLAPIDAPLLRALELEAPCRIVDLGCGGGGTTLELRRKAPPGSVVHGVDVSPELVAHARERAMVGADGVDFTVADVATFAPARPYERVASRFGVMFFERPLEAFVNLARWVAPGGRFAFAVWGPASDNPWWSTVREVVAGVVALPPADPSAPGPFRYGEVERLLELLEAAGLSELGVAEWRGALPIGGGLPPAEAAAFALAAFSSFGDVLARAGGDAPSEARLRLAERFARHAPKGQVTMDARVHVVTGRR